MNTKHLLIFVITCFFFTSIYAAPVDLKELEELLKNEKYSILLEKTLNILNTREADLTPIEAGTLNYFTGLAYKKNNNIEMATSYLKKIEQEYPASKYLKNTFLELADIYKEDYFQQESYWEKAFEKFPKTPEAIYAGTELSKSYLKLKNFRKAVPVLEKMVTLWKVAEKHPNLYMLIAVAYSGINDYIEAIDYLRIAEKKMPSAINTSPLYIFEAGKICYNNQNFKKAILYLSKLVNIYPSHPDIEEATLLMAHSYEREKNMFMSAIYLIKAIGKKPTDKKKKYSLLLNLGRILGKLKAEELKNIKKNFPAYANAKRLLTLVKENSPLFEQKRNATILLSGEFKKTNDIEKIIDNYFKFLKGKRDPLVEKYFKQTIDDYIEELHKKKKDDAIFKFWIKIKSKKSLLSGTNLLKLGGILYDMKLFKNAKEIYRHLERYSMFSAYWPIAKKQLLRISFKRGEFEKFLTDLKKLKMTSEKEKAEFLLYKLIAFKELEKTKELNALIDKTEIKQINDLFSFKIAEMKSDRLVEKKKHTEALNLYKQLQGYNKIDASQRTRLLLKIADLYYNKKDFTAALDYYKQVEKQKKNDEWILFRKICIYQNTDRPDEAQAELKKLKETHPDSYWIKQAEKYVR
ncbi:MAG: tetratricopeptide repeat protein [bacterium]|nr:tetratricopeptide repeat protein [bacterium]